MQRDCEKLYPNVKFKTYDMIDYEVKQHDIILCTSCEHVEQDLLNEFIGVVEEKMTLLLSYNQTIITNYLNI